MFWMRQPTDAQVRQILESQGRAGFSYPEVGATAHTLPAGYQVHHERFELGRGAPAFERAKRAVREWKMFDMVWLRLLWPDQPVVAGTTVGVLVRHFGFWSLNCSSSRRHFAGQRAVREPCRLSQRAGRKPSEHKSRNTIVSQYDLMDAL